MEVNDKLSIEEIFEIINQVKIKHENKLKIKFKVIPVYLQKNINTEGLDIEDLKEMHETSPGYCDKDGNAIIFIDKIQEQKTRNRQILLTIELVFHETKHAYDLKAHKDGYEELVYNMDSISAFANKEDYIENHDTEYIFEVLTDLYGIESAKQYILDTNVNLDEEEYINNRIKRYLFNKKMYDLTNSIDKFIYLYRNLTEEQHHEILEKFNKTDKSLANISPILDIFINEDLTIKNIYEIQNNEKIKTGKIDKRIIYAFLSSNTFLTETNIKELSSEEKILLEESIQYSKYEYEKKLEIINTNIEPILNDKLQTDETQQFFNSKELSKMIKLLNHCDDRIKKLEYAKKQIQGDSSSRGNISILMFYIIGGLISIASSITTIIYNFID